MAEATLIISSRNYSSWSLRGWLITRMSGLAFREQVTATDDAATRQELLLLSSSILVPRLIHDGLSIWDTLAIAEYLNEIRPKARMYPADRPARAHCRAIAGEMHSGFGALRASLPMNLRAHRPGFHVWSAAQTDIDRILDIWRACLKQYGGPFLFGARFSVADAMYAPVTTRFRTYDVKLDAECAAYSAMIQDLPDMRAWKEAALAEQEQVEELEVEF
ncbi:MAG: glutathione S-transferase [Rhodospirillales bacterium]|nr:glutathione S-transferase [Rhodospirillales bacterium]